MAIIYSYPKKSPLSLSDLVLITDESNNKTNNGTISDIKEVIDVVDSLTATLPISVSASTGSIDISSRVYGGGSTTGHVPSGGDNTKFLRGDGTWVVPSAGGPGTGTQNSIAYWSTTSGLGDSIITQPSTQQINIAATANSTPTTLQIPIATGSGPNATLGGISLYGGLYNVAQANISPATNTGVIQFGSQLDGQIFDFRNNKIAFDSDATNTYIKANTSNPESLEIHADQNIQLRPDGYVVIYTGAAAPTNASDSGDQGSIVYDDNYLYVCVQDDTWKRVALSTW
jgi:hypothetical protein